MTENQIGSDTDAAEVLEQLSSFKIYLNSCVLDNKILQFIYMNILFFWSMILFQSIYNWYKTIDIKHGHIYVYNESLQKLAPSKIEVLSIYFSHYDAVKFRLQGN